jgi:carbamoyl-phosphate synthase large subunit
VSPVGYPGYLKELFSVIKKNRIKLLVPTVDLDLKLLSQNRKKIARLGCFVLISKPEVINICQDKRKTFRFLSKNGFDTPQTFTLKSILTKQRIKYPLFLKPWDGYASKSNTIVKNRAELEFFGKQIPKCIAQEFVKGTEYTCDVFVDFDMNVRCVVPRMRIEVRSGEVSKAQIVKNEKIMAHAKSVVEKLSAGPGIITIQLIETHKGQIKFIEINPRFGGGVPLSIKAGANFPRWILQMLLGKKSHIKFDGFEDKLTMLRYDKEVWLGVK